MINIFQAQRLAYKKVAFSKGKSAFVIIPIALMFAIIVFASSEALSLMNVVHDSIFSPIADQNEVLELNKETSIPRFMQEEDDTGYTTTDNTLISTIANVENTSMVSELQIDLISTDNIFDGVSVNISELAGLDDEFAALYTDQDFSYIDGSPIPIILNANDFIEVYEDWQGQSEISIDYTQVADPSEAQSLSSQSPLKSKAIAYDRDELIGKVITLNFGGLDDIYTIKQETTTTGIKYVKKTDEEVAIEEAERKSAIEKYWDYDKISTPLSYEFIIVGISEGTDKSKTYIPMEFANILMNSYLSRQMEARNGTVMAEDEQNSVYLGLVYDGVNLTSDSESSIFAGIRRQVNAQIEDQFAGVNEQIAEQNEDIAAANRQNTYIQKEFAETLERPEPGTGPGGGMGFKLPSMISIGSVNELDASNIKISYPGSEDTYKIPGLVYEQDRSTSEILGEYTAFDLTTGLVPLESNTILIKISDIGLREQVVSDLNEKGFNYQDYSLYEEYEQLESQFGIALNVASITFMIISALFILINMAKFVSEGRREIGIFRAIGASQGDIKLLFILQSFIYIVISIIIGTMLGAIAIYGLSSTVATYAQGFIGNIASNITLSAGITGADFILFSMDTIYYALILIAITLIVSLIPAAQASKVSPVEAIRNN